jgi:hypothetical protein
MDGVGITDNDDGSDNTTVNDGGITDDGDGTVTVGDDDGDGGTVTVGDNDDDGDVGGSGISGDASGSDGYRVSTGIMIISGIGVGLILTGMTIYLIYRHQHTDTGTPYNQTR